jgi:G3E family GTPase
MVRIDIISGFLGAGKTTLIRKILREKPKDELIALIENEFGDIGIDGELVKSGSVQVREIYSGCICCTLAGQFERALTELIDKHRPDRIMIEPTGIAKLSDVLRACASSLKRKDVRMGMCLVVVNVLNYDMYMKNWPEFFSDQIIHAKTVAFSRSQNAPHELLERVSGDVLRLNPGANIMTTPWMKISAGTIVQAAEEDASGFAHELEKEAGHRFGHPKVGCTHHAEGSEACGAHGHDHDADAVFDVWAVQTAQIYPPEELEDALRSLSQSRYGTVLRAKGIVQTGKNAWAQFDFVPGETKIRDRDADFTGRICVIGQELNKAALNKLFSQN